MENWKKSEIQAYDWFKENIDSNAELCGGEVSTIGDIYSPLYDGYIEVKDITSGARCGQFTKSTIKDNPFAQAIYEGKYTSAICCDFVRYHYNKKNITHFIIINNGKISFYSFNEFFANYIFEVQAPYEKRSGTRKAPQKDIPTLLGINTDFTLEKDGKVYCHNSNRWGEYVSVFNTFDYFISKTNKGELRKRSTTQNLTWHLLIKEK